MAYAGGAEAAGASASGNSSTYAPQSNPTTPRQGAQEVLATPVCDLKIAARQDVLLLRYEVPMAKAA